MTADLPQSDQRNCLVSRVDMIGAAEIHHGERGDMDAEHPEACLCGYEPYFLCPESFSGSIGGLTIHPAACDRCDDLERWKAEATPLLELLDRCHALLPAPARAPLGSSKAEAVEAFLTRDIITDLTQRINEGIRTLDQQRRLTTSNDEWARLHNKALGMALVRDWLRSYV